MQSLMQALCNTSVGMQRLQLATLWARLLAAAGRKR